VTLRAVLAGLAITVSLWPAPATADESMRLSVEWEKVGAAIRASAEARDPGRERDREPASGDTPWIGLSPTLSIVAHDWNASQRLWGYLGPTDQLRLSRSSRMVVTRVRLGHGRIAPFAQLGLGQWRVDTSVLITLPSDVEIAAQVGAGFELRVAPGFVLALELDGTTLYREAREPQMVACPRMWGSLLAGRAVF